MLGQVGVEVDLLGADQEPLLRQGSWPQGGYDTSFYLLGPWTPGQLRQLERASYNIVGSRDGGGRGSFNLGGYFRTRSWTP